jgi:hypothetical protein
MIPSVLQKSFKRLPVILYCLRCYCCVSISIAPDAQQLINWSNKTLAQVYDPSGDAKLKKWELTVTDDLLFALA